MFVRYCGRHAAVNVPSAGIENVERGAVVEVPDQIGEGLLAQGDQWKKAGAPKPSAEKPSADAAGKDGK